MKKEINKHYKKVITNLLVCPKNNKLKSARTFWGRESTLFLKLFKRFPDVSFWAKVSFKGSLIIDGRLPSFRLFFDTDNNYWINLLSSKWKAFHWNPTKFKTYQFKEDVEGKIEYKVKKRGIRSFFN